MVKLAKKGHGQHSSKSVVICVVLLLFALFYLLFVCKYVLYCCHRVTTQLQLTNISYIMSKLIFTHTHTHTNLIKFDVVLKFTDTRNNVYKLKLVREKVLCITS
jgi:hypothetical protein